jgi:nucleoside-diphosphate-sugar epimerase
VQYLNATGTVKITAVDKLIPQTSYMSPEMQNIYTTSPNVKLIQADLKSDYGVKKVFIDNDPQYDYIVNLCGETRFGQSEQDYKMKCVDTCKKCMLAATNQKNLKMWIEVSTAQVYEPQKKPVNEKGNIAPFTKLAENRYACEQLIEKSSLPFIILRPSIVYGPADKTGLVPRLVCAACYKYKQQKMKFLWTPNLAINTVHVRDVAAAIWTCVEKGKSGSVYNLSDKGNTTQGSLNPLLSDIFNIKVTFVSAAENKLAKSMMSKTAEYSNNQHVPMWSDLCKAYEITASPLTPYIDCEILTKNYLCIDGSSIEKELGFKYKYSELKPEYLREVIDEYVQQDFFPDLQKMEKNKK